MLSSKKWQGYGLSTRKFPSVTLSLLPQLSKGNHRPSLMPRQLPRRPQPKSRSNAQRQNVPAPWFLRTKSIYDLFTTLCFPPLPATSFLALSHYIQPFSSFSASFSRHLGAVVYSWVSVGWKITHSPVCAAHMQNIAHRS